MKSFFDKLNINENNSFYFYFNKKLKTLTEKQLLKKLKKDKIEYSFGHVIKNGKYKKYHGFSIAFEVIYLRNQKTPNSYQILYITLHNTKFRN